MSIEYEISTLKIENEKYFLPFFAWLNKCHAEKYYPVFFVSMYADPDQSFFRIEFVNIDGEIFNQLVQLMILKQNEIHE